MGVKDMSDVKTSEKQKERIYELLEEIYTRFTYLQQLEQAVKPQE